jgi:SAM-dependent methyltransferase
VRTDCPACGAPLKGWHHVVPGDPGGSPVLLLRCVGCRSAVTAPEAPGDAHEADAYGAPAPRLAKAAAPVLAAFDRQRLALLRDAAPPPGSLLDVGAGRGRFVAAARAAGYDARGIEPTARGVGAARETYGVELAQAGIGEAAVDEGSLDVATLWHVLEHVDEPLDALDRVTSWLRPGGVVLVGMPNLESLQAQLAGGRWYHFDVPRHRMHLTPGGLDTLLRRAGLEPLRTHHVLAEHNPFGMWQSLVPTPTPSYAYHLLKGSVPLRPADLALTVAALPLAPVAAAAEAFAGFRGRGGTTAVLARRH